MRKQRKQNARIEDYDKYIDKFHQCSKEKGSYLGGRDLQKYDLPSDRWLINNCPDPNVTTYLQFIEWLGYQPKVTINKSVATKIIYNMQSKIDRPLMYDDFRNPNEDEIGVKTINKFWGSMNKMKEALGLEIIQESMTDKHMTVQEIKDGLTLLCNDIYKAENRKIISSYDINAVDFIPNYCTCHTVLQCEFSTGVRGFLHTIDFDFAKPGRGMLHYYDDGEVALSQHEFIFSEYLRNRNLQYNVDYFRDVPYKNFIPEWENNCSCDYEIHFNNKIIYVEIAGVLRDHKKYYYENIQIPSRTREAYKKSLMKKENMLKSHNLEYYIIFPSDMAFISEIFNPILNEHGEMLDRSKNETEPSEDKQK